MAKQKRRVECTIKPQSRPGSIDDIAAGLREVFGNDLVAGVSQNADGTYSVTVNVDAETDQEVQEIAGHMVGDALSKMPGGFASDVVTKVVP